MVLHFEVHPPLIFPAKTHSRDNNCQDKKTHTYISQNKQTNEKPQQINKYLPPEHACKSALQTGVSRKAN